MDPLSIIANAVALVSSASQGMRTISDVVSTDTKSRHKLFQLQDTATAINTTVASISDLPIAQTERMRNFSKDVEKEKSDIGKEMTGLMRSIEMGSLLKTPWIRRDIDKLQKRLDMLQRNIHEELNVAYQETGHHPSEDQRAKMFKKKENSLGWLKLPWVNRDTTRSQLKLGSFKTLQAEVEAEAREAYEVEQAVKASLSESHPLDTNTDRSSLHDSLLDDWILKQQDIAKNKGRAVQEELMRAKEIPSVEQSSDTPATSPLNEGGEKAELATGTKIDVDGPRAGLIQRRPQRPSTYRHQDVFPPILTPTIRRTRISYHVLTTTVNSWLISKVTVYVVFVALILGSTVTTGLAVWKAKTKPSSTQAESPYDDNFFGTISQGLGTILGVFCMVIPLLERNRVLQPDIPVWCPRTFRWLLVISTIASILSMTTQCFEQAGSIMFGYVSMATQLVATMLLVIGSTEKITQRQRTFDQLSMKYLVSTTLQQV